MKKAEKKHRFFATFLCVCMLFTMPGLQNVFPVVTAAEQNENFQKENIITTFNLLPEDIKEQTVFIGTDLDELDLPKELTVCLLRESSEQKVEESEQEETVTISGITWQSEPEYDRNAEGIYIFAAVLPNGYILAEGVSLPEITVTLENGTDAMIQALLDRIAALPEVEEYFATEPNMEDKDAYAEWEEKQYEYAEESFTIWEEYGTLTKEQQAQMLEEYLAKLTAWVEIAETLSDHVIMLADNSEHHGELDWQALTASDITLTDGKKYYLSGNIKMDTIIVKGEVMLCLNGQTLTHDNSKDGSVIVVESGKFTLCDCSGDNSGCITGGTGRTDNKNIIRGGGVYVCPGAEFVMSGGTISGNSANQGAGVCVGDNSAVAEFTMTGGIIQGNNTNGLGGGIYVGARATATISNAIISDNVASDGVVGGGGMYLGNNSITTLSNVTITNNQCADKGGGIYILGGGDINDELYVSGNINISGNSNTKDNVKDNVYLANKKTITVTDELTGHIGVTTQFLPGAKLNPDSNKPLITLAQGGNGHTVSAQDFACISSDNKDWSVYIIEDKAGRGKVLVLGNESIGNLSGMDLSIKDGSSGEEIKLYPDFAEKTYKYSVTVPNSVRAVGIVAAPKNAGAVVAMTVQNADNATDTTVTADNIALAEGENTIKVNVTEDGALKVYIVTITREAPAGNQVTITFNKDGIPWTGADAPSAADYKLTSDGGGTFLPSLVAPDGTYKIYIGKTTDTGVEVTVAGAEVTATVDYYTVTFYDGTTKLTTPAQQIVLKGAAASAPTDNPTKTGFTFSKWVTADGGSTEYDFANEKVTGITSVYASWTVNKYTIIYNGIDGATFLTKPTQHTYGTDTPIGNPTKTGYTFAGWKVNDSDAVTTGLTLGATAYTADVTLTATWTANQYAITYNGIGGATLSPKPEQHTYGTGTPIGNPTKTGYTFAGWKVNDSDTVTTSLTLGATAYTADITLTATWKANTYQVTLDNHGATGGDLTASQNVTYAGKYGPLPVPLRDGYTFQGWYTEADGKGAKIDAETTVTTASAHTLHAYWLDKTAPNKPTLQDSADFITSWTNKQTVIPLTTYDGVGVTELWVSVDGNPYTKVDGFSGGTGSVNYEYTVQSGKHTYQFQAKDAAGNTSAASDKFEVRLDQEPPVIGTLTYDNAVHLNLWHWIIGKESIIIHVPVTDTGSGVTEISYTRTDRDAAGNLNASSAVTDTATVTDGEAEITVAAEFRGTIAITCTDAAGNAADSVTVGKDAGGVIVEDQAPTITILADRNISDMQGTHTRPGGVDVSKEYYDSVPALFVTVKDDTGNAITAGIASITYKVGDSTEQSVNVATNALQAQVSFTIPVSEIPTGSTQITIKTTDNAGNLAEDKITIKVKGPEKQPAAVIDYRQEKLTGLVPDGEYQIEGKSYTADQEGYISIEEDWLGSSINIVKKGNNSETSDSPAQNLSVPARPAAPNAPELSARTENSITLKTITGAQYRLVDGTGNWQDSTVFEGLNPKTGYSFRACYSATDTSFASKESKETEIGTVPTPPTPDKLGIDYKAETLAPASDIEAFSDQSCNTPVTAGSVEDYMGQTVYIRYPAVGIFPESQANAVTVPERPTTPVPGATDASYPGAVNGIITGLTAGRAYEYRRQNGDGTWDNWISATASADGQIGGLKEGTYEVRVQAVDTVSFSSEAATVSISEKPATKLETPDIKINYAEEMLTGFVPGVKYFINGKPAEVNADNTIKIDENWLGTTLSIMCKGNEQDKLDSDMQSLPIPTRPQKPTPAGVDVSTAGGTGKLTGLAAGTIYEISTDGGKTWVSETADEGGEITGLAPGAYVVRVKASDSSFASEKSKPATIGAYQVKVTFIVDGEIYREISVDYGTALTDIPSVPPKKDAGDQIFATEWCSDEQGSAAVFTDITTDMTVYAVYIAAYTVTLQVGEGYTLSAETGSASPVKEGGSFTFRFVLDSGYQTTGSFAVKVNDTKVELKEKNTYTITDIRENKTVTVEGIAEKPSDPEPTPTPQPAQPTPTPQPTQPTPTPTPQPVDTSAQPVNPPAEIVQPTPTPKITLSVTENKSEGRKPETTPEPEKTQGPEEPEDNETQPPSEPSQTQTPDTPSGSLTCSVGKGAVIVTLNNVDETVCAARVADASAVAQAVLSEEELAEVKQGQIIEIRIDVERLETVPSNDSQVIEKGIEDCQEQISGLVMGMYVDISMYMRIGSGDWNAIHATKGPVEITLDVPDELAEFTADFYIMRAHDGEYLLMEDLDETPETITIRTEAFSTYAILYRMQEDSEKLAAKCSLCHICPTFLGICYFVWLAIVVAMMLAIYFIIRRKRQEEESETQQ